VIRPESVTPAPVQASRPAVARRRETPRRLTPAGEYLWASATNERAAVDIRPDRAARRLFSRAFELAVRRRFRPDAALAEIARSVANAGRRHAPVVVPALEAEMLVRDALGEVVPIEEIPVPAIVTTHVLVFASLVDELALDDDELTALILAAEDRAAGGGGPPPARKRGRP
jgi:hypothetical protein